MPLGGKSHLQCHMTEKNLPTEVFTFQVSYKHIKYWQYVVTDSNARLFWMVTLIAVTQNGKRQAVCSSQSNDMLFQRNVILGYSI